MWFDAFRDEGWNTYYEPDSSAAIGDLSHVIIAFFSLLLGLIILVIAVGTKGNEKWPTLFRLLFSVHTGIAILLCVTGQDWQVSSLWSRCEYTLVPRQTVHDAYIHADIGIRLGLYHFNLTLEGPGVENSSYHQGEIQYTEKFDLHGDHGHVDENLREAKERGCPNVILYVLEYFEVDAGGLRWRRVFAENGHFAFILLWSAFVIWVVANLVLMFDVGRGSGLLAVSGALMVSACILYSSLQPSEQLVIKLEDGSLRLVYGWCFWLCLISGAVTLANGVIIAFLYWKFPAEIGSVFLMDPASPSDDEQCRTRHDYDDQETLEIETPHLARRKMSLANPTLFAFDNAIFHSDDSDGGGGDGGEKPDNVSKHRPRHTNPPPPYTAHDRNRPPSTPPLSTRDRNRLQATPSLSAITDELEQELTEDDACAYVTSSPCTSCVVEVDYHPPRRNSSQGTISME